MKITFNIDYHTNWGESVYIVGDIPALGGGDPKKAVRITVEGDTAWSATVETPATTEDFGYSYVVISEDGRVKREWGAPHAFARGGKSHTYQLYDRWQDQPWDKPYYASAFTDCICRREKRQERVLPKNNYITLSVSAPMVRSRLACRRIRQLGVTGTVESRQGSEDERQRFPCLDCRYPG